METSIKTGLLIASTGISICVHLVDRPHSYLPQTPPRDDHVNVIKNQLNILLQYQFGQPATSAQLIECDKARRVAELNLNCGFRPDTTYTQLLTTKTIKYVF